MVDGMDSEKKVEQIRANEEAQQLQELKIRNSQLKYRDRVMDGTLLWGPPANSRQKFAIREVKAIIKSKGMEVTKEIFDFTFPADYAFFFSKEKGWFTLDLRFIKAEFDREKHR